MARVAQTATAVLGVLSVESMTGYEVRQAITTVLGHFWHESYGQIYPTLTSLEADGLIGGTPGERPGSRRYHLTSAGRAHLRTLLAEPTSPHPPRNGTLLRVFFGRELSREQLAGLLDAEEASARARLAAYAGIRAALAAETTHAEHAPYWQATVRAGELTTDAHLAWIAETRSLLLPPPGTSTT
jgi:DNA-binding PadR family transcriptional regulator